MSNFSMMTDDELFGLFSDYYKSCNNHRPSFGGYWTRETIINWLESEFTPENQELRRQQWEYEESELKKMEENHDSYFYNSNSEDECPLEPYEDLAIRSGHYC